MLKRLKVENFKCLDGLDLVLGDHALLMGLNGTGKSTVVEVLERLRRLLVGGEKARDCFPASTRTRWSSANSAPQRFEFFLEEAYGNSSVSIQLSAPDDQGVVRVEEEVLRAPGALFERRSGEPARVQYEQDNRANNSFIIPEELAALPLVMSWAPGRPSGGQKPTDSLTLLMLAVSDILPFRLAPTRMEVLARNPTSVLASDGANFSSWLLMMDRYSRSLRKPIEQRIAAILPGFQRFILRPEGDQFRLVTEWQGTSGRIGCFDFDELSDGQRLIAVLSGVAAAIEDRGGTLVLDEPDNYVALQEIQPLLLSLMDQPGMQLVVASHHPEILDTMAKDFGIVFEREDDIGPVRIRPWTAAPDEVLTPSELVARGEIHGSA